MPTVYAFFVFACDQVTGPTSIETMHRIGTLVATVEARAFDGFEIIDRHFGHAVTGHRYGSFSAEEAVALAAGLGAATPEVLAGIESDRLVAEFYWAMRNTAEEAVRRQACMTVRYSADPEEQELGAQAQAELERREDAAAAATVADEIAPYLVRAASSLDRMEAEGLIELVEGFSRQRLIDELAEQLANLGGHAQYAADLVEWLVDHEGIAEVFGDDAAIGAALGGAGR